MKEDMYLRIKQVTARTGLSRATIYGMMSVGTFPEKTALGVRAVGWLASEIEQWMLERKAVEKTGKEVSPGRRRASLAPNSGNGKVVLVDARSDQKGSTKKEDADWGSINTPVSDLELDSIRARLRAANRSKHIEATVIERTVTKFELRDQNGSVSDQGKRSTSTISKK